MATPKKVLKRLQSLAKRQDLDVTTLEQEWQDAKQNLIDSGFEGNADAVAVNAVMKAHRKYKPLKRVGRTSNPIGTFVGFKIGDLGMQDDAQRMRDWAKWTVENRGIEHAVEQNLVVEYETNKYSVLDSRQKVFGRVNPGHLKPLDPKLRLRRHDLIFLAKTAEDEDFNYTRLQTNDNKLAVAWDQLPEFTPVTFPARIQAQDSGGYRLTSSSAQDSKTIFTGVKVDWLPEEEYVKYFDPLVTGIEEIPEYHDAMKDTWDRWVIVKGIVDYIGLENPTYRGIPGLLIDVDNGDDPDYQVRFYVPEHLKITFGPYSEIYLLGRTMTRMERDPETQRRYVVDTFIQVWGFYGIPGLVTDPEGSILEDDDDDIPEAFIPV
jgi:hypothetical protein